MAGDLRAGEPVVTLHGNADTVVWVHTVAGQADMYNLTVANDHTFAVGSGQWAVHNTCGGLPTTVSQTAQGDTVVSSGARGSGPFFESTLSADRGTFTVNQAWREGAPFHASEVLTDQFHLAGGDTGALNRIVLNNVRNDDTLERWDQIGSVRGSELDKMTHHLANPLGVTVGEPYWDSNNPIYEVVPHP